MTEAVLMTGKRGTGKSLNAVKMIQQYMSEGRAVATNLDLFLDKLMPPLSRSIAYRLPDVPMAELLNHPDFPQGNPNPINEEKNGLLVLDECAAYLNSREWKDSGRTALIAWLAQSRKNGWDLLLIAQGASMIDKQVRNDICDVHGRCLETSKIGIPFITPTARRLFGVKLMMPKFHVVNYFYGFGASAVKSYSDIFRSSDVVDGYNTLQKISAEFGNQHLYSNLSAWHLRGRYMSRSALYGKLIVTSIVIGLLIGSAAGHYLPPLFIKPESTASTVSVIVPSDTVFVTGVVHDEDSLIALLSDGRSERVYNYKADLTGTLYQVGNSWFKEQK